MNTRDYLDFTLVSEEDTSLIIGLPKGAVDKLNEHTEGTYVHHFFNKMEEGLKVEITQEEFDELVVIKEEFYTCLAEIIDKVFPDATPFQRGALWGGAMTASILHKQDIIRKSRIYALFRHS